MGEVLGMFEQDCGHTHYFKKNHLILLYRIFCERHTAFKNSLGKLLKHLCMMEHMREVEHVARSPSICRTWKEAGPGQSRRDEMGNKVDRLEKELIFVESSGFHLGCELLQKGDSKIWKCKYGWKCGFDPQD